MRHVFDFNQALMDFGATLCTARKPQVPDLPDADGCCRAFPFDPALDAGTWPRPRIVVTAAVIERDGSFLVTGGRRGVHLEGFWEFPGGKCEPGESLVDCLRARDRRRSSDAAIVVGRGAVSPSHTYAERIVELHFFACELNGEPRPLLGQEMRWVTREELRRCRSRRPMKN